MAKEDGRKNNGGHRNGGRKSKAEELKARTKIQKALKAIYGKEDSEEAEIAFLTEFARTKDGMKFCAEHLLGKPKEIKETTITSGESTPVIVFGAGE